jgi:hypothetical protein
VTEDRQQPVWPHQRTYRWQQQRRALVRERVHRREPPSQLHHHLQLTLGAPPWKAMQVKRRGRRRRRVQGRERNGTGRWPPRVHPPPAQPPPRRPGAAGSAPVHYRPRSGEWMGDAGCTDAREGSPRPAQPRGRPACSCQRNREAAQAGWGVARRQVAWPAADGSPAEGKRHESLAARRHLGGITRRGLRRRPGAHHVPALARGRTPRACALRMPMLSPQLAATRATRRLKSAPCLAGRHPLLAQYRIFQRQKDSRAVGVQRWLRPSRSPRRRTSRRRQTARSTRS